MTLHGVLLAAGQSRRFGSDKRMHRLPSGRTLMQQSLLQLAGVCDVVWVALRPQDDAELLLALQPADLQPDSLHVHRVGDAVLGMGHSLASTVRRIQQSVDHPGVSPIAGLLVALADMPFIRTETLWTLRHALVQGASIVVPTYEGQRGHPVGFAPSWLAALTACDGDTGAKSLLQAHAECVRALAVDDPGILQDIDTEADRY